MSKPLQPVEPAIGEKLQEILKTIENTAYNAAHPIVKMTRQKLRAYAMNRLLTPNVFREIQAVLASTLGISTEDARAILTAIYAEACMETFEKAEEIEAGEQRRIAGRR